MVEDSAEGPADQWRSSDDDPTLVRLRQQACRAADETKSAREALERAERSKRFWEALVSHVSQREPGSVLLHLDRNRDYVRELESRDEPMWRELSVLQKDAHDQVAGSVKTLGRTFPEAARRAGLTIDSSSRHPRYTFGNGFIRVELDERRLLAKIETRDGDEQECGLDLDVVVAAVQRERARLFDREFKPEAFLRSLYTAYTAVLRAEGLSEGTEVPIRKVTHRLAKNLNRFSSDEFNVDLARAVREGHMSVDGRQLHLNHTRNTRQGMLLHGLEQGGYVGFISFKREEQR